MRFLSHIKVLLALGFILSAVPCVTHAADTDSEETKSFYLGPIHFSIPMDYLINYFPPSGKDKISSFEIIAELPDLTPVVDKSSAEFENRLIATVYYKDHLPVGEELIYNFTHGLDPVEETTEGKYKKYIDHVTSHALFIAQDESQPNVFICNEPQKGPLKEMHLGCTVTIALKADALPLDELKRFPLEAEYHFRKDHLNEITEIDQSVKKLIEKFLADNSQINLNKNSHSL